MEEDIKDDLLKEIKRVLESNTALNTWEEERLRAEAIERLCNAYKKLEYI